MQKIIYIPKAKRNELLNKPFNRYFFRKEKIKDILYWIETCHDSNTREIVLAVNNKSICWFSYRIYVNKETKEANLYIPNFNIPEIQYRNYSFGTKTLKEAVKNINLISRKAQIKIININGSLFINDLNYWTISMPMYLKFAKAVMGKDIICKISDKTIDTNSLVNIIQEHVNNKIAVNFEFCKEN